MIESVQEVLDCHEMPVGRAFCLEVYQRLYDISCRNQCNAAGCLVMGVQLVFATVHSGL